MIVEHIRRLERDRELSFPEGAVRDRNQARPRDFPIGSVQSRAAARAMFAEQVSDDLVVDMAGLPSFAHATNRVC